MVSKKRLAGLVFAVFALREFVRAVYFQLMTTLEPHSGHEVERNKSIKRLIHLNLGCGLAKTLYKKLS